MVLRLLVRLVRKFSGYVDPAFEATDTALIFAARMDASKVRKSRNVNMNNHLKQELTIVNDNRPTEKEEKHFLILIKA